MLAARTAQVLAARPAGLRAPRVLRPVHLSAASGNVGVPASSSSELAATPQRRLKLKILNLVSACVESNALVLKFETFAGRVGMVAFLVAVSSEVVTEHGVFRALEENEATCFAATALACVIGSAVLALTSKRKLGLPLREAVIASLTAVKRSNASVSQKQVDKAVDYVFDRAFDNQVVNTLLEEEYL